MERNKHTGNGHGHATETPDVSHIKNIDVTHETSDVSVSALLKFVGALTVMTIVVYVLMWGLFKFFSAQAEKKDPPPGPMALTKEERLPPEPRLQAAQGFGVKLENGQWVPLELKEPQAEYRVLREQWERQLNCQTRDVVEEPAGASEHPSRDTAHAADIPPCVPINEAIQKLLDQGLASRPGGGGEDIALPTAASSGRMTEKVVR